MTSRRVTVPGLAQHQETGAPPKGPLAGGKKEAHTLGLRGSECRKKRTPSDDTNGQGSPSSRARDKKYPLADFQSKTLKPG
jgi:hypothetical protein